MKCFEKNEVVKITNHRQEREEELNHKSKYNLQLSCQSAGEMLGIHIIEIFRLLNTLSGIQDTDEARDQSKSGVSRMNVVVIDNEQQHANNIGACMEGSERH
jgi:hypothetical protein